MRALKLKDSYTPNDMANTGIQYSAYGVPIAGALRTASAAAPARLDSAMLQAVQAPSVANPAPGAVLAMGSAVPASTHEADYERRCQEFAARVAAASAGQVPPHEQPAVLQDVASQQQPVMQPSGLGHTLSYTVSTGAPTFAASMSAPPSSSTGAVMPGLPPSFQH